DRVDLGFVEEVEELAGVGAESFDVTALALGVERIEDERGFAGATQPRDDDVAAERQIEVETFKVVLAHPAQADAFGFGRRRRGDGARFDHGLERMKAMEGNATPRTKSSGTADTTVSGAPEV